MEEYFGELSEAGVSFGSHKSGLLEQTSVD